jgi:hypothetical protein
MLRTLVSREGDSMKQFVKGLSVLSVAASLLVLGSGMTAQPASSAASARPYHNGSVWGIGFIRVKPGMDEAYMSYLAGQWKNTQEAMKKEGLILSYKVITTEAHSVTDFNMMLMTEYKDMATMEANEGKYDALAQKVIGDDEKQQQGYKDRSEIREVLGNRLAREVILSPK